MASVPPKRPLTARRPAAMSPSPTKGLAPEEKPKLAGSLSKPPTRPPTMRRAAPTPQPPPSADHRSRASTKSANDARKPTARSSILPGATPARRVAVTDRKPPTTTSRPTTSSTPITPRLASRPGTTTSTKPTPIDATKRRLSTIPSSPLHPTLEVPNSPPKPMRPSLGPRKSTMSVTVEQRLREMELVQDMLRIAMAEDGDEPDEIKEEYGRKMEESLAELKEKLEEARISEGKDPYEPSDGSSSAAAQRRLKELEAELADYRSKLESLEVETAIRGDGEAEIDDDDADPHMKNLIEEARHKLRIEHTKHLTKINEEQVRELTTIQSTISSLEADLQAATTAKTNLENKVEDLEHNHQQTTQSSRASARDVSRDAVEAAEEEAERLRRDHATELDALRAMHKEHQNDLKARLAKAEFQLVAKEADWKKAITEAGAKAKDSAAAEVEEQLKAHAVQVESLNYEQESELFKMQKEVEKLKLELSDAGASHEAHSAELEAARVEQRQTLSGHRDRIAALEAELAVAKSQSKGDASAAQETVKDQIDELTSRLQRDHEDVLAHRQNEYEAELGKHRGHGKALETDLSIAESEHQHRVKTLLKDLADTKAASESANEDFKSRINDQRRNIADDHMKKLENLKSEHSQELTSQQEEVSKLATELTKLEEALNVGQAEHEASSKQAREDAEKDMADLKAMVEELELSTQSLKEQYAKEILKYEDALQTRSVEHSSKLKELEHVLSRTSDYDQLKSTIETLEQQVADAKTQNANTLKELTDARNADNDQMQVKLQELKKANDDLRRTHETELQEALAQSKNSAETMEQTNANVTKMEAELRMLREELAGSSAPLEAANKQVVEKDKQLLSLRSELDDLRATAEAADSRLKQRDIDMQIRGDQLAAIRNELDVAQAASSEADDLRAALVLAEARGKQLQEKLASMAREQEQRLTAKDHEHIAEIEELRRSHDSLAVEREDRLAAKDVDIATEKGELQKQMTSAAQEAAGLRKVIDTLYTAHDDELKFMNRDRDTIVAKIRTDLEAAIQDRDAHETDLQALQEKLDQLHESNTKTLDRIVREKDAGRAQVEADLHTALHDRSQHDCELKAFHEKLDQTHSTHAKTLETAAKEHEATVAGIKASLDGALQDRGLAQAEIVNLHEKLDKLRSEYNNRVFEFEAAQADNEERRERERSSGAEVRDRLATQLAELEDARKELPTVKMEVQRYRSAAEASEARMRDIDAQLRQAIEATDKREGELGSALEAARAEIQALKDTIAETQADDDRRKRSRSRSNGRIREEMRALQVIADENRDKLDAYKVKAGADQALLRQMEARLKAKEAEVVELHANRKPSITTVPKSPAKGNLVGGSRWGSVMNDKADERNANEDDHLEILSPTSLNKTNGSVHKNDRSSGSEIEGTMAGLQEQLRQLGQVNAGMIGDHQRMVNLLSRPSSKGSDENRPPRTPRTPYKSPSKFVLTHKEE